MYYCRDCGATFEKPKSYIERHNLDTPPYESFKICPVCNSNSIFEKNLTHCRCCGAKLKKNDSEYCSSSCEEKGKILWERERKRRQIEIISPLNLLIKELAEYNKIHKTDYSNGQFVAIKQLEKESKKCKKLKKNT